MSTEVFSYAVDIPFEEEIQWMTLISEGESGKEKRYQKWLRPKRTFRIKLDARNLADTASIWNMYSRMKGAFDTFYYENPNESPVTAENVGSGDGTKKVFYLGNSVNIGTGDCILTSGTLVLKKSVGGTGDYLAFSAYTVSNSTGQITTNSAVPSGDVLQANYNFQYNVRFKDDNLTREAFAYQLWRFGLELIEVI